MSVVTITSGDIAIRVSVLDTPPATAIVAACPINSIANTWGEEVYFSTPISQSEEIRLASPCNIWGRALDDVKALSVVSDGANVTVEVTE